MKHIYALFIGFAFLLGASFAQAADPFTVVGVPVDATGNTAIEAQTLAIQDGQARAAQAIIERLTLDSERLSKGLQPIEVEIAAKMIRALEIANEKRSSSRYLGDITVAFNPREVQSYLKANDLNMIASQARDRLVIPLSGSQLETSSDWFKSWEQGGFAHALTPVRALSEEQAFGISNISDLVAKNEGALKALGAQFGVQQILIADLSSGYINVTDIALDSGLTRNFTVNGTAASLVKGLEDDWKQSSVSVAENAVSMAVSVLYEGQREWLRLKEAINGSAQIQDARLDALSKDGALMTITYGGDMNRLRNELAFKGVDVRNDPALGVVFARTGRF